MKAAGIPLIGLTVLVGTAAADPIIVVTEQWPPRNYAEDGDVRGVVTEIVRTDPAAVA